jgi:hypothetical protein
MKKLIAGAIVAAALTVPATPAFAIHDPFVPAGDCSNPGSQAVGHPATDVLNGTPAGPLPNAGGSDFGVAQHVFSVSPPCEATR